MFTPHQAKWYISSDAFLFPFSFPGWFRGLNEGESVLWSNCTIIPNGVYFDHNRGKTGFFCEWSVVECW